MKLAIILEASLLYLQYHFSLSLPHHIVVNIVLVLMTKMKEPLNSKLLLISASLREILNSSQISLKSSSSKSLNVRIERGEKARMKLFIEGLNMRRDEISHLTQYRITEMEIRGEAQLMFRFYSGWAFSIKLLLHYFGKTGASTGSTGTTAFWCVIGIIIWTHRHESWSI